MTNKGQENLVRVTLSGVASFITFLIVSFFNGFITAPDLQAEVNVQVHEKMNTAKLQFVGKDSYNLDQKIYIQEITALKSEMKNIGSTQLEIKQALNKILKRI